MLKCVSCKKKTKKKKQFYRRQCDAVCESNVEQQKSQDTFSCLACRLWVVPAGIVLSVEKTNPINKTQLEMWKNSYIQGGKRTDEEGGADSQRTH